jgi:hypothetical protein
MKRKIEEEEAQVEDDDVDIVKSDIESAVEEEDSVKEIWSFLRGVCEDISRLKRKAVYLEFIGQMQNITPI